MPISVFSVADAILYEAKLKGINIDPLKLQKLLYHVQYHHIATTGESAFIEPVEAWEKGPAIRVIFKQFQYLGFAFITTLVPIRPILPSTVNSGIEKAVTKFGHLDSSDFAEITHYDLAYIKAWYLGQNTPLKPTDMKTLVEPILTVRAQDVFERLTALHVGVPADAAKQEALENYFRKHTHTARLLVPLSQALVEQFQGRYSVILDFFTSMESNTDEYPILLLQAIGTESYPVSLRKEIKAVTAPFLNPICEDPKNGWVSVLPSFKKAA